MNILKKIRRILPVLLIALVLTGALTMTGCDTNGLGTGDDFDPVGTWIGSYQSHWGWTELTFTFHANGTHTVVERWGGGPHGNGIGGDSTSSGTWTLSDRSISILISWFNPDGSHGSVVMYGLFSDNNTLLLPYFMRVLNLIRR